MIIKPLKAFRKNVKIWPLRHRQGLQDNAQIEAYYETKLNMPDQFCTCVIYTCI